MINITNNMTYQSQLKLVAKLSIPAIMAEISSVIMQYIDTAMVGSLGANASASIGLVSTSTWLIGGLCISGATGFSVQVSQLIGAKREDRARDVLRQSLIFSAIISCILAVTGILISGYLPVWLGGNEELHVQASRYFLIYSCILPAIQLRQLSGSMLQCSGDMKTPSIMNSIMCLLDVIFNGLLIFPTRSIGIFGLAFTMPGAGLGVTGAALGTAISEVIAACVMLWFVCVRSEKLAITGKKKTHNGSWKLDKKCMTTAGKIAIPMAFEHAIMCGAQVVSTLIVAPLGTVSIAANSLAVTAESVCYMPGYGVSAAATTLVGHSIGAGQEKMAKRFAGLSVMLGTVIMTVMGVVMYFLAPVAFTILTTDVAVRELGTYVLRIEMFAEPFYGISIVAAGALRGAGDTLVPSLMNFASMWGVRIVAACILAPRLGLAGVWIAMCGELCVRGILFLVRLLRARWIKNIE